MRPDGARLAGGACPTLIEWDDVHPADAMPASGVHLEALALAGGPQALPAALLRRLPEGVRFDATGASPLVATFTTPRGPVTLKLHPVLRPLVEPEPQLSRRHARPTNR